MTDKITLDPLALAAAKNAYEHTAAYSETEDSVEAALHTYFATAQVRGLVHELPVIPGGVPGYESLARVLALAYDQSSKGKGKERHANAKPFDRQPILEIARMVGVGYQTGQIQKKVQEATGMAARGQIDAAKAELLGAIVYAAAAFLYLEEQE